VQYVSAPDSWVNRYAVAEGQNDANSAFVGDAVRASGTFSYIAGYTAFLTLLLFYIIARVKEHPKSPWNFPIILFGFYGSLLSGSRSIMVIYAVTLILFFVLETDLFKKGQQLIKPIIFTILIVLANFAFNDPIGINKRFERSWGNFSDRWTANSGEGEDRLFLDLKEALLNDFEYNYTGVGLGSTYQGATSIWGTSPLLDGMYFEGELYRLVVEGGFMLLLFRFLLLGFILSKLNFSMFFKLYLFVIIGIYSMYIFNVYNAIFLALGLIILDSKYNRKRENRSLPIG